MIDLKTIQELISTLLWVVPLVIALVAAFRAAFKIPARIIPLFSVVIGLATGLVLVGLTATGAFVGVVIGLSASGLYDVGKKTVLGV